MWVYECVCVRQFVMNAVFRQALQCFLYFPAQRCFGATYTQIAYTAR